jgi:hypothetical protein
MRQSPQNGIAEIMVTVATGAGPRKLSKVLPGSEVQVQFQQLHEASGYFATIVHASCDHLGGAPEIARIQLTVDEDPSEGIVGGTHVDIPVDALMHRGYAIALHDVHRRAVVSCGDLKTNRPF